MANETPRSGKKNWNWRGVTNTCQMGHPIKKIPKKLLEKELKVIGAILCCLGDFLSSVELSLCWNAFLLDHDRIPLDFREKTFLAIDAALQMMVSLFVKNVYCGDGTLDSKTTKMHCHMHCVMNYQECGGFMHYNAGMGEHGLNTWAKSISGTAQKRGINLFNQQTRERLFNHLLLMKALRSGKTYDPDNKLHGKVQPRIRQPILYVHGDVTLKTTGAKFRFDLATGACISLIATEHHMSPEVIVKIQSFFVGSGIESLQVFAEAHLEKTNQNICGCPDYDRMGSWLILSLPM